MKLICSDKLIIYLTNDYIKQKNIEIDNIENCFYNIFDILKEKYNLKLTGLYDVDIYIDINYGLVVEMIKQNLGIDYYEEVDMQIKMINTNFLIEVYDLEPFINSKIYKYKNNYYSSDLKKIEFGKLIYDTSNIFKHAKQVEI